MCRMLAKVGVVAGTLEQECLLAPHSLKYLSKFGKQPDNPAVRGEHHDGSGFAFVNESGLECIKRKPEEAWDETYQNQIRQIQSKAFIAHNRLASKGLSVNESSVHPFLRMVDGKPFAFCHNGAVQTYFEEASSRGVPDTLVLFEQLVCEGKSNNLSDIQQRLVTIAAQVQFKSMTAFLLTPKWLMIWRLYNDRSLSGKDLYEEYYTLYLKQTETSFLVASEPLDEDANWIKIPNKTVYTVSWEEQPLTVSKALLVC